MPDYSVVLRYERVYEVIARDAEDALQKARDMAADGVPDAAMEESDEPTVSEM